MLEKSMTDSRNLLNALELGVSLEKETESKPTHSWRWIIRAMVFSLLVNVVLFYYFSNAYVGFKQAYRPVTSAITYEITLSSDNRLSEDKPLVIEETVIKEPVIKEPVVKKEHFAKSEDPLQKEHPEVHSENMTSEKIAAKPKKETADIANIAEVSSPEPELKEPKPVKKAEISTSRIAQAKQKAENKQENSVVTTDGKSSFEVVQEDYSLQTDIIEVLETDDFGLTNSDTTNHSEESEKDTPKDKIALKIPEKFLAKMGNIEVLDDASLKETTILEPFDDQGAKRLRIFNKYLREMITQVNQYFNKPTASTAVANGLINFEIDPDGYLVDSYIFRSSGSVLLDQSALQALRSVKKFKVPESRKVVAKYYRYLNLSYNDNETTVEEAPWEASK